MRSTIVYALLACGVASGAWILSESPDNVEFTYYENGEVAFESQRDSAGRLHGKMIAYDVDGTVVSVTNYSHGSFVSHKLHNKDGSSITQ